MIEAGGGVIWRHGKRGIEVLVIHRPGRDWSLPKGKLDPGETIEQCALREVAEETGYRCELGPELPSTSYTDRLGRPKTVRYWAMRVVGGEFVPNAEVDAARWLRTGQAKKRVTLRRDARVIDALTAAVAGADHARAG